MGVGDVLSGIFVNVSSHLANLPASEAIIFDIATVLILSAVFAFVAKWLRQPLILAYVLTGLVIGPIVFGFVKNMDLIHSFSEIGVAFLLFIAGLEISFKKIKEANLKKIIFIGLFQVAAIFGVVFLASGLLGISTLQAAYIGIILAFGSTMVDVKLLADKNELVTLHGRLILGILLLQDLIAIIAIVIFTAGGFELALLGLAFVKLLAILGIAVLLQKFILNKTFKFAARSNELLLLSCLGILFLFVMLSYTLELSIAIGAFVAGVSLANSPFKIELESKVTPLRDFFAILFFVALGMQISFNGVGTNLMLLGFLLIGALILKPLITLILLRVSRYQPRTSFITAISLAQLSEFSLIIGTIGVASGVLSSAIFSTVILATIITMSLTPYSIGYKEFFFKIFRHPMSALKFLPSHDSLKYENNKDKEILIVGFHRMGGVLINDLMSKKDKILVIDYNPDVINALMNKKISCIYGDIKSPEMLNKININKLKSVISTAPDYETNLFLLQKIKDINPKAEVILTGNRISETLNLYENGADYVVTPKIVAGEKLADIIHKGTKKTKEAKRNHMKHLERIHKSLY